MYKPDDFPEEDVEYFYKYFSYNNDSKKPITEGTLKFTHPLDFNDPFDCVPCLKDISPRHIPKDHYRALATRLNLKPGPSIEQKQKILTNVIKQIDKKEFLRGLIHDVGIFCATKSPLNILMWAHYADMHKGFIIEFRIPSATSNRTIAEKFLYGEWLFPLPVRYERTRPKINFHVEKTDVEKDEHLQKLFFTKSEEWQYEQEYRALVQNRGPGIFPYGRNVLLSSVIGGIRMGDRYAELKRCVDNLNAEERLSVGCYQASVSDTEYGLSVPGHPRLNATALNNKKRAD